MMLTPLTVPILSLSLAVLALLIGIKNYRRKAGMYVRGVFSTGSGTSCNDVYVTEVILENLKDRAVTIFSIYLKIGHNYYVELENLEEKPLVLKAFETFCFQAEDGIRDLYVTGVQTCALPISLWAAYSHTVRPPRQKPMMPPSM